MSRKVDFDVVLVADAEISVDSLKPGQELTVAADDGSGQLHCTTADGLLLGTVPETAATQMQGAIKVTVRSVKKRSDDPGKVASVQARAVPADTAASASQQQQQQQQQAQAPVVQPEDPSGFAVTVAQLQRLADNPDIVLTLQDERLQKLLLEIDGAPDREKMLEAALKQEAFRQFADKVVGVIGDKGGCQQAG